MSRILARRSGIEIAELLIILISVSVPLFINMPYRINIFLSWEGAYRLYLGQIPYRDFGLPLGFGYWLIPALFFKIFGPYLISLVKAQAFINLLLLLSFRSILNVFGLSAPQRLLALLIFILSYTFTNFWPWYNQSVFVFEVLGLNFILWGMFRPPAGKFNFYPVLGAIFIFWAIFTKQDYGGLALVLALTLLAYHSITERQVRDALWFSVTLGIVALAVILPFLPYDFGYWFNYGQPPHESRLEIGYFLNAVLGGSPWEKFYLLIIVIILLTRISSWSEFVTDKRYFAFALLTLGIMGQALITKVTSPFPVDNHVYYHGFACAFIIYSVRLPLKTHSPRLSLGLLVLTVLFWWSGMYWTYTKRFLKKMNVPVTEGTFTTVKKDTTFVGMSAWKQTNRPAFRRVMMPTSTIEGINRIEALDIVRNIKDLRVLNMSELTPLAYELPYELETGVPLWYHQGVSLFGQEIDDYCRKIRHQEYDLVLFEIIPYLDNFYPEQVRDCLQQHYQRIDTFLAPRRPTDSYIEVYIKPLSRR